MVNRIFSHIPVKRHKRNVFDLSHEVKLSCNMGDLVPILCQEVVPGDKFRVNTEMMMRFAPMLAPIMHRINVYTHYFFVPNRLVWDNWETFITGGASGDESPVFPQINHSTQVVEGTLADYLGLPDTGGISVRVSALPFRAYQLIYNEYYRDQNLMEEIAFSHGDGFIYNQDELDRLVTLRKRAWEKDYFTSALPWAQRGGEVSLPLADDVPVSGLDDVGINFVSGATHTPNRQYGPLYYDGDDFNLQRSLGSSTSPVSATDLVPELTNTDGVKVDLSDATPVTINDLRRATRLQAWLERNARAGGRYIEQLLAHFGVVGKDARLQRPQYLGGGKTPVVISEVLQTSATDDNSPQANMAGHGIAVGNTHQFKHFFDEHGYVIGIMSVLPRTGYMQGVDRHFFKFDKFDYFFPEFAHLGEQPIYNKELFVANDGLNDEVFGYTPRYAEYKHAKSRVHGDFRKQLSFWHLNRIFNARPNLNASFIQSDPSTRIFAVDDNGSTQKVWVQLYNDVRAIRLMPKFGVPTF